MNNAINWFEIATADIARATRFYEAMLGVELKRMPGAADGGLPMSIFPAAQGTDQQGIYGALVQNPQRKPGAGGSTVYLNANGKLDQILGRVDHAGGSVVTPKTDLGPHGFFAMVKDTEGNVIGLHAER
jgi:predicted enzyme related to lactoylglutathione lyase